MQKTVISSTLIDAYRAYLLREEKSTATQEKYLRDIRVFGAFLGKRPVTKELVLEYKKVCISCGYAVRSINSMLASINSILGFMGLNNCRVKNIRIQRRTYCTAENELSKEEYLRLVKAAGRDEQLSLVIQTICGTGIRVSELRYFTVEALQHGEITVDCKNKTRTILLPGKLRKMQMNYVKRKKIVSGAVLL